MDINRHYWADADRNTNLINLFEYLHYTMVHQTTTYRVYHKANSYYAVIYTDQGYWYYRCENPKQKLRGSDLIRSFCAMVVTGDQKSIWEKLGTKYQEYLDAGVDSKPAKLTAVSDTFNHFETLAIRIDTDTLIPLYRDALQEHSIQNRMAMNKKKEVLFPIYQSPDTICGYLKDTPNGMEPYPSYANTNAGIWYTRLPKKINTLIIFSTPKDAIAFYVQFKPEHTVCIACPTINYSVSKMLLGLKKVSKAKKMYISFTGNTTMESYMMHLQYIAELQPFEFIFNHEQGYIQLILRQPEDEAFVNFYKKVNEFNESVAAMYKKYNHTKNLNQTLILQNSIVLKRVDSDTIHARIPMEVNAVKFLIWAYYRFFLPSDIMILKPKERNWFRQYLKSDAPTNYKTFKLAM